MTADRRTAMTPAAGSAPIAGDERRDAAGARRAACGRAIMRALRGPSTAARLFVDRFLVPWRLSCLGVTMGRGCVFAGHPGIWLAPGAAIGLGVGVRLMSRADSNPAGLPHPTMLAAIGPNSRITIGDGTGISGASIVARAGITIGRHVLIGAGACIWDTDFHPLDPRVRQEHETRAARAAPVQIDDDAFIGARAVILKGVRIGGGAVVGAGAVVTKDVGPGQVVAGNPAEVIGALPETRVGEDL